MIIFTIFYLFYICIFKYYSPN